jgi:hypothetical protein
VDGTASVPCLEPEVCVVRMGGGWNPSSRTIALGFTQLLTEMGTRQKQRYFVSRAPSAHKADNLTANCEPIV